MITILGLGFVGLTTGLGFAKKGFKTYGFDINEERLNTLKQFNIPFYEPHLNEVLQETHNKTFFLDADFEEAIKNSKAVFICVGTPSNNDGSANLQFIFNTIEQILSVDAPQYQVIVTKSTVPPSTVAKKVIPFVKDKLAKLPERKIGFASNPEFLREGYCWEDFIRPDRIVIGVEENDSQEILNEIYAPFDAPIHYVSYNTAEYIKYLSNTLLSTLISFSNEMSIIGERIGDIDIPSAFKILHEDKRWYGSPASMAKYVYPGCGYGGYCLPKDTSALVQIAMENGFAPKMLSANLDINHEIKHFIAHKIEDEVPLWESIGILGLSFKPDSDDVRFTPSKNIIQLLIQKGYKCLYAYDPHANEEFKKSYPYLNLYYCKSLDEILDHAENIVILTGWKEFSDQKEKILSKKVFDYRYIF